MSRAHLGIPCVEGSLDGDDELGDDWQNLAPSCLQHVLYSLHCQELVGLLCFPDSIEEDGQVVAVVQLAHIYLHNHTEPVGCPSKTLLAIKLY